MKSLLSNGIRAFGGGLYRLAFQVGVWAGERAAIRGIEVVDLLDDEGHAERVRGLESALRLIEEISSWRLDHFRRDVRYIVISSVDTVFKRETRSVHVSRSLIEAGTTWLAVSLVFMGTQARLYNRGNPGSVLRRTRLCYEEQLSFARCLSDPFPVLEALTDNWDQGWWMPKNETARRDARAVALGVPG